MAKNKTKMTMGMLIRSGRGNMRAYLQFADPRDIDRALNHFYGDSIKNIPFFSNYERWTFLMNLWSDFEKARGMRWEYRAKEIADFFDKHKPDEFYFIHS